MRTAVFLQTRLDSSRLPYKALHDLDGKPLASRCMEALTPVEADVHGLLCDQDSLLVLSPLAQAEAWEIMAGPRDDVLGRFLQAARQWKIDTICRATGDNPLVSRRLTVDLLASHRQTGADYSLFTDIPVGSCVECVQVAALEALWKLGPDNYEREHVCPGIYRRPEHFRLNRPQGPRWAGGPGLRYTIDTLEDYLAMVGLFRRRPAGAKSLCFEDLHPPVFPGNEPGSTEATP